MPDRRAGTRQSRPTSPASPTDPPDRGREATPGRSFAEPWSKARLPEPAQQTSPTRPHALRHLPRPPTQPPHPPTLAPPTPLAPPPALVRPRLASRALETHRPRRARELRVARPSGRVPAAGVDRRPPRRGLAPRRSRRRARASTRAGRGAGHRHRRPHGSPPPRRRRRRRAPRRRSAAPLPPAIEARRVVRFPGWHEVALWLPERRLLVAADVLGTVGYFLAATTSRSASTRSIRPSRRDARSGDLAPAAVAVGHGTPVTEQRRAPPSPTPCAPPAAASRRLPPRLANVAPRARPQLVSGP